ncbi:MAG: hypothetical protein RLZZ28_1730 [Bacteroidota bacterium]
MNEAQKIFSADQLREADLATIRNEPIAPIDLMERAAGKCADWLQQHYSKAYKLYFFCGKGNNGGDGLAMARILAGAGYTIQLFLLAANDQLSDDCRQNKNRLLQTNPEIIREINNITQLPEPCSQAVFVDALFGTGLSGEISGLHASVINWINEKECPVISLDIPSGLFADKSSVKNQCIVKATVTLSFQFPKLAFLFPENEAYTGNWEILPIGIDPEFIQKINTRNWLITHYCLRGILKKRNRFSHKGNYGHALLVAGSYGKIGAAQLAAKACLRSGVGLLTTMLPQCGYDSMQTAIPEAMVITGDEVNQISGFVKTDSYQAIGIGPGIGCAEQTQQTFLHLLQNNPSPMVIDADALNILGMHKDWLSFVPENSILTPHPGEWERLAGKNEHHFLRQEAQLAFSIKWKVYIVLKGANTCTTTPSGLAYFNNSGNPGMAKGGSGDLLTGMITALLAQSYSPLHAALLGVYLHGFAGDLAAEKFGQAGMMATDIADMLPEAFLRMDT